MSSGTTHDLRAVRVVTFDAAGTLLQPYPSVGLVYREVALRYGWDRPADEIERDFRAAFHRISKDPRVPDPEARERDFWTRVVHETFAAGGADGRDFQAFFEELWDTFSHGHRWRLFDDARATLETLRQRGYRLGVLSNWDRRLHNVLAEMDLTPLFDAVVISSEAGAEKPDVGIFRIAESRLGARPDEILHIGDSRQHDLAGAREAGWQVRIVRHDPEPCEAGVEIARLGALIDLLAG